MEKVKKRGLSRYQAMLGCEAEAAPGVTGAGGLALARAVAAALARAAASAFDWRLMA